MRIGVNCFILQENMGGLRQYFRRLFRELLDNDNENSYIFFYFRHNAMELEYLGNDRWKENAVLLRDQHEIAHHLNKVDVYFCPFGAIWPRPVPLPSVVTLVDIQEKYYPQFFSKNDLWNREYHYEASTRAADQVITISEFSKDSISRHHRIERRKIHVAYLAADASFYQPVASDEKLALELPERFIFYPANRWHHKNHDNLLKALLVLRQQYHVAIQCVLTGFDYDQGGYPLRERIIEYGLGGQVKVIGYVTTEDLRYVYSRATMLCFPSLFEGFGMPLVEAMAAGCPVVCSNSTSIPEVVGDSALLFNPESPRDIADKVYMLTSDADLRIKLIRSGKERAKLFSVKKLAQRHLEVFDLAARSYRKKRYLFYKYLREPLHAFKMFRKKDF